MLYFSEAEQVWNILPCWENSELGYCFGTLQVAFSLYPKVSHRVINDITHNQYDLSKIHLWPRTAPCYCQLISGVIH